MSRVASMHLDCPLQARCQLFDTRYGVGSDGGRYLTRQHIRQMNDGRAAGDRETRYNAWTVNFLCPMADEWGRKTTDGDARASRRDTSNARTSAPGFHRSRRTGDRDHQRLRPLRPLPLL